MATFTQQVTVSGDDGCWSVATPTPYFSSSATMLRVGDASSTDFDRSVYFRFPSVTIPKGAVISAATLTLTSGGFTAPPPPMAVKVEAADNAAQVTSRTDVLARTRAAGTTAWAPATWPASGTTIVSPNFAATLQQVTDRAGWVSGNAVQLFLEDTSPGFVAAQQVSIQPQEGATAGQGAVLNVTYTTGTPPTASATVPASVASGATYTVTDTSTATTSGATIASRVWRIVSGGGSLSSTTAAAPTVTAPTTTVGVSQVLGLIATDSNGVASAEQTYTVTVTASAAANAGPDQGPVASLATVQLTSAASTGSPTKYLWSIVSGGGTLSSTTVAAPTLKAPATVDGVTVVVQLQVGTTAADSTPDTMQVTVRPHTLWRIDTGGVPQPVKLNAV